MTPSEIQEHLDEWKAADKAVASAQSYTIGNRSLTLSDAESIRQQINYWEQRLDIANASAQGVRNSRVVYSRWG